MKNYSKQSKNSIRKFLCVLLIIAVISTLSSVRINATTVSYNPPSYSSLTPHDSITVTSDSNFTDYGFTGSGTAEDPYMIEGYNITTTSDDGIYITTTTKYFIIRNCYVDADKTNICIRDVADGTATVINNTCANSWNGIWIESSCNSTVSNNTCYNNDDSIDLYYSGNSTVSNNICYNNGHGIILSLSGSSTVVNNTCSNNANLAGIGLVLSDNTTISDNTCNYNGWGIYISSSDSSTISKNTCSNNNIRGIWSSHSDFCVITYNLLQENVGYGVYLSGTDSNIIHHNIFVDNNLGGTSQAYDERTSNIWYETETLEGNYWSDWSGGSYSIDGSAGAIDPYPLGEPIVAEYNSLSQFTLLILVVPLLLTIIISRKRRKIA
jgi:parallel beta-helix repeat protein